MYRFFFPPSGRKDNEVRVTGEDARHMLCVLRLEAGDEIVLLDGTCMEHAARITCANSREVTAEIYETRPNTAEPRCKITLYQGLPKGAKLETVIQKCVELGVNEIVPLATARCVARPDEFTKKLARYNRIAYEAAKQSRRGIVPEVRDIMKLGDCDFSAHELTVFAYEDENETTLKQAIRAKNVENAALVIGAEGGFAPEEAKLLKQKGAVAVTLGPRILRTETAGLAVLAMLLYEWEG